jgi:hypothetical protein
MLIAHILAATIWTCSVPLLPDYNPKANAPDVGEGVTYVYVGDTHLRNNYGADASFSTRLDERRGWYDSGIHFGPLHNEDVSAQIEISQWQRFDYRPHVAIAWALPHGASEQYKDTGLFLDDGRPHRLGIYVRGGMLRLLVDNRTICAAPARLFVKPSEPKYFQIRTETSMPGTNGRATVSQIRLKRDTDPHPVTFRSDCIMHRNGIFWQQIAPQVFAVRGAFYPGEATFFTGIDPDKPCRITSKRQ